jgi:hypothetical protein
MSCCKWLPRRGLLVAKWHSLWHLGVSVAVPSSLRVVSRKSLVECLREAGSWGEQRPPDASPRPAGARGYRRRINPHNTSSETRSASV